MARDPQNLDPCLPQWLPREPHTQKQQNENTCLLLSGQPLVLQSWALIHSCVGSFENGPCWVNGHAFECLLFFQPEQLCFKLFFWFIFLGKSSSEEKVLGFKNAKQNWKPIVTGLIVPLKDIILNLNLQCFRKWPFFGNRAVAVIIKIKMRSYFSRQYGVGP